MSTPQRWFSVVKPMVLRGARPHLGLGAGWWPAFDGDAPYLEAVDSHTRWSPVPIGGRVEWLPLLTDLHIAERYFEAARQAGCAASLLAFGLSPTPTGRGWDVGPPQGGHSAIPHELSRPEFDAQRARWLNQHTLFDTRSDAEAFLAMRAQLAAASQDGTWESSNAWGVIQVEVLATATADTP